MKTNRIRHLIIVGILFILPHSVFAKIQTEFGDSTKTHVFTLGANLLTRGEYMQGALPVDTESIAAYISERVQLSLHYKQPYLELLIIPQHSGVWGASGGGAFNLREAWAQTDVKGFFLKLGRQSLVYDDERALGSDDWSVTGAYHDALKLGYEGYGHRIHLIGAYCQNNANTNGGTRYIGGMQPYKNMEALWYHYDFKRWFCASLLFINTGIQSTLNNKPDTTFYQQMVGSYVRFRYPDEKSPTADKQWFINVDASFYYQLGRTENDLPLNAWMAAIEAKAKVNEWVRLNTGYFHLSGDENYTVPPPGALGMQRHTRDHSFNLLYGSKHQFYGAVDFFYLRSYYGGYSPGLQDWHIGTSFTYKEVFDCKAEYHNLATAVRVQQSPGLMLGHELEITANYRPFKWMTATAGYTFMQGTKTMEMVRRSSKNNQSHWVYLMLVFNPNLVTVRF